jgi:putative membrane protein insertion efficiency factor
MGKINRATSAGLVFVISAYRYLISPLLGNRCRFYPSCSVYAQDALRLHGVVLGSWKSLCRLICCHPWHSGGYDPVSERLPHE